MIGYTLYTNFRGILCTKYLRQYTKKEVSDLGGAYNHNRS